MAKYCVKQKDDFDFKLRIDPQYYLQENIEEANIHKGINFKKLLLYISIPTSTINIKKFGKKEFYYIDISSIDNITGIIRPKLIKVESAPARARKMVKEGDVIVSSVRPDRNAVALISSRENGYICSTGFIICRPDRKVIDPGYLFILLNSRNVIEQLISRTTATMYPTINQSDIQNLLVRVPDLEIQKEVSKSVLDSLNSIYNSEKMIKTHIELVNKYQYEL